jgi:hypothetical protein
LAAAACAAAAGGRAPLRPALPPPPLLLQLPSRFREAASVQVAMLRVVTLGGACAEEEGPPHRGRAEEGVEGEGAGADAEGVAGWCEGDASRMVCRLEARRAAHACLMRAAWKAF